VGNNLAVEGVGVVWIPVYTGMTILVSTQQKCICASLLNKLFDKEGNNKKPLDTSGLFDPPVT
jgi:hypothetical protein